MTRPPWHRLTFDVIAVRCVRGSALTYRSALPSGPLQSECTEQEAGCPRARPGAVSSRRRRGAPSVMDGRHKVDCLDRSRTDSARCGVCVAAVLLLVTGDPARDRRERLRAQPGRRRVPRQRASSASTGASPIRRRSPGPAASTRPSAARASSARWSRLLDDPRLGTLWRWWLATRSAHEVYRTLGFAPVDPQLWMQYLPDATRWI